MLKLNFNSFDYSKINQKIQQFIKKYCQDQKVIVGLSGGIDSALTCKLAVDALGANRVKALIIKNIRYTDEGLMIARQFAKDLKIEVIEINTDDSRKTIIDETKPDLANFRKISSIDARITDLIIRTIACRDNLIYLGTINGTERLTGWYPKGALVGDFCPIGGLLKHQIIELAKFLKLPNQIIHSVSDDASKICSGCGSLSEFKGISYQTLDKVLYYLEIGQSVKRLKVNEKIIKTILNRIKSVDHKKQVFSPYPKINMHLSSPTRSGIQD
ncbi:MAG: NH(3)-dependent NAD(+) synthetase [Berkelbacteria bacterium GW2011_GWA2_38_9]|uniref:NH(3)-dependent NAD(+) synthetase n=1 Tax=Berkelbacteria bacterium GW2011_GWA2_38_9 TaxID=1618334 RepID=A0A0G0L6F4_9BACT|nr:MAG: NH(3)-dependent NAD(+) synthetase [Berkelbacteria bacterium GW2011_GWA2_38_9]